MNILFIICFTIVILFMVYKKYKYNKQLKIVRHNAGVLNKAREFKNSLIKNKTNAEDMLFQQLKSDGMLYYKFSFQEIIPIFNKKNSHKIDKCFIVDFYFPSKKLAVEIDGGYHNTEEQKLKDKERTKLLKENRGIKVIRFTNEDVYNNKVIDNIKEYLK